MAVNRINVFYERTGVSMASILMNGSLKDGTGDRKTARVLDSLTTSLGRKRTEASIDNELSTALAKLPEEAQAKAEEIAESRKAELGIAKKRHALALLNGGDADASCRNWCHLYTVLALLFSAYLNGYCNAHNGHVAVGGFMPWAIGAVVPFFVFLGSKVAGKAHKSGNNVMACVIGAATLGALSVSLWECQYSINMLMHFPTQWMGVGLAVSIDVAIVGCELTALGVFSPKK